MIFYSRMGTLDCTPWRAIKVFEVESNKIPEVFSGQPCAAVQAEHVCPAWALAAMETGALSRFPKGTVGVGWDSRYSWRFNSVWQ